MVKYRHAVAIGKVCHADDVEGGFVWLHGRSACGGQERRGTPASLPVSDGGRGTVERLGRRRETRPGGVRGLHPRPGQPLRRRNGRGAAVPRRQPLRPRAAAQPGRRRTDGEAPLLVGRQRRAPLPAVHVAAAEGPRLRKGDRPRAPRPLRRLLRAAQGARHLRDRQPPRGAHGRLPLPGLQADDEGEQGARQLRPHLHPAPEGLHPHVLRPREPPTRASPTATNPP